jgi:hypothetical protein
MTTSWATPAKDHQPEPGRVLPAEGLTINSSAGVRCLTCVAALTSGQDRPQPNGYCPGDPRPAAGGDVPIAGRPVSSRPVPR